MRYFFVSPVGRVLSISSESPVWPAPLPETTPLGNRWINRNDLHSIADTMALAAAATAYEQRYGSFTTYLWADNGPGVSPRFDVIRAPQVGDQVSRAFNGDYYPEGVITRVTPTFRVRTSTGAKFSRRRQSASWTDGSWSLVEGWHDVRNPSF